MQTNMADESLLEVEETGNQPVNANSVVVSTPGMAVEETVNDDILHEAFGGTADFDQESVAYTVQADDVSQTVAQQMTTVVSDTGLEECTGLDSATQIGAATNGFGSATYRVVTTLPDGTISIPDELIDQSVPEGSEHIESENGVSLVDQNDQQVLEDQRVFDNDKEQKVLDDPVQIMDNDHHILMNVNADDSLKQEETIQTVVDQGEQDIDSIEQKVEQPQQQHVQYAVADSGAPLGSSQNPIRIIQQGNNYTPMQNLNRDQLHSILQVVHQQHVAKNAQEAGGSVLFNPANNTRIVYRIIYPSELHKGQQTTVLHVTPKGTTSTSLPIQQTAQLPKRPYRKRGKDEDEDKVDGPEMSKEEKEERKKHRPRTRSGRVSKPPKHMVKDYKHIHPLDWDEDYDDSDGGYSDYKGSDEEGGRSSKKESTSGPELYSGLSMNSSRPKNHKCQTCEKSYIGQAGLARHYRLKPSHGSLPEGAGEDGETNGVSIAESTPVLMNNGSTTITTNSVSQVGVSTVASSVGSSTGNLSEDSNTQDSIPSSSGAISPITTRAHRRGRGGYRGRGRWTHQHYTAPARKKQKLKEVVKTIENEDLMEVVLPRLVKCVSLWEFMLMKIETCNSTHPRADHIYQEYLALHKQVRQVCQQGLQIKQDTGQQNGIDADDSREETPPVLKLEDEAIAKSLGLSSGSYEVKDLPVNDYESFHYKFLTSDPCGPTGVSAEKRTIQVVSRDELVSQPPSKRSRTTSLLHSVSSTPTTVTMTPSAAPASSLLTSIVSNSGLKGTTKQQTGLRTVSIQQPQTSVLQAIRVQQAPGSMLQNVSVQQPRSVVPTVTVPPSNLSLQPSTAILQTVTVPSQPQVTSVLRTVAVPARTQLAQTSLLRSVQQPVVVSTNKHSNGTGVMSLLNNSRSAVLSQSPSIALLKSGSGQTSHILVASPSSSSVTGSGLSEIPQSQAAQVVSVLPTSIHTTPLSLLSQTPGAIATDFTTMAPDDFMDNSDDSLVSSVSGLSSANSSGLVSVPSSLPNGDVTEVGFSSDVKVNGVSTKSDSLSVDTVHMSPLNDSAHMTAVTSLQEDPEHLTDTNAIGSTSSGTPLLLKLEDGEFYTIASTGEPLPLSSAAADSVLATVGMNHTPNVNGLLSSSELEDMQVNIEKDALGEEQCMLPAEEQEVLNQVDPMNDETVADMALDESMEDATFTLHQNAQLYQAEDGTVIIQNPDGTSFQFHGSGENGLSLESVQELLAKMASGDQVQAEVQQ